MNNSLQWVESHNAFGILDSLRNLLCLPFVLYYTFGCATNTKFINYGHDASYKSYTSRVPSNVEIPYLPLLVCLNQEIPHSNGFRIPSLSMPLGASVDAIYHSKLYIM
jgi:hypothetical protein